MRSSHAALTDSRSSVSRVARAAQPRLCNFSLFPPFFLRVKSWGRGCTQRSSLTLLPKGGALHYETKNMCQKYFIVLLCSRK